MSDSNSHNRKKKLLLCKKAGRGLCRHNNSGISKEISMEIDQCFSPQNGYLKIEAYL